MSLACTVVVYRGRRVSKAKLTALIRRAVPPISAIRHGNEKDLHFIVIVDDRRVDVPAKQLAAVKEQLPHDAPLSAVVQAAWNLARPMAQLILRRAAGPNRYELLARELSVITGTSWMLQRSASRKTIGRRFDGGVERAAGRERLELLPLLRSACSMDAAPPVLVMKPGARAIPFDRRDFERALH